MSDETPLASPKIALNGVRANATRHVRRRSDGAECLIAADTYSSADFIECDENYCPLGGSAVEEEAEEEEAEEAEEGRERLTE